MSDINEILKKYFYIAEDIQQEQDKLNKFIGLRCEAQEKASDPLKAQALTGMPHGYDVNDQTYQAIEKIMDSYQEEIAECIKKINYLLDLKRWLDKAFSTLTEDERRIVYLRYEKGLSMEKIPYVMKWKYGRTKVFQTMDEAKRKIKRIVC